MNLLQLFNGQPKTFDVSQVKYNKPSDGQLLTKFVDYVQNYYQHNTKHNPPKVIVGIDGEVNCLIAAKLLKQALKENVAAIVFDVIDPMGTKNAVEFCRQLRLEAYILQRTAAYQNETRAYHWHNPSSMRRFFKRFTNYHLLIQAEQMKAQVVDTADKSDRLLGLRPEGFYGHAMPFYSLYKSEVYDLARTLNIPYQATLYQEHLYQNSPLPWDKIDPLLYLLTEKQLKVEEVAQQYCIDPHWLSSLQAQVNRQLFQTTVSQFII